MATVLGQTEFGHDHIGPMLFDRIWPTSFDRNFFQTAFGQIVWVGLEGGGGRVGPRRVAPKGGAQNFALFSPLPLPFRSFSLWRSSRGILVVFEAPGPSNVHVCSVV